MATTNPTGDQRAALHAEVRRLAAEEQLSNRAIARRLGVHHTTVGRILRTTPAPDAPAAAPAERTTPAPPAPTSGAARAPRLLYDLDPTLIQDLNVLTDARTGALIAPVRQYLRTAAAYRRAALTAVAHRIAAEDDPATGRTADRARVAP
ncbi:hypothetical protein [Streptomyces griseosporeus]|uniref:hypothetical protein n=1 Tax=Streptomyces griseosporeus TaxID=1910 RepID=UPI0036FC580E